jgi:hypothetical protein
MAYLHDIESIRAAWPIERILNDLGFDVVRGRSRCPLCDPQKSRDRKDAMSIKGDLWHCFRCGEGGDVFDLFRKTHGVRFREALEALCASSGIMPTAIGYRASRLPRVSRKRIEGLIRSNWSGMNSLIKRERDAAIAQSRACKSTEDALWDSVEAEAVALRRWNELDAVTQELMFYLQRR